MTETVDDQCAEKGVFVGQGKVDARPDVERVEDVDAWWTATRRKLPDVDLDFSGQVEKAGEGCWGAWGGHGCGASC